MLSFKEYVKKVYQEDLVGIYPPLYGGVGNYPKSYFTRYTPYIDASRKAKTNPPKKKKHKKKKHKKKKHQHKGS
jgi:hypothetical protein